MGLFDFFRRKKDKPVEQKPEQQKNKPEQPAEKKSEKPIEQKKVERPFHKRKPRPYHARKSNNNVKAQQPLTSGKQQPKAQTHGAAQRPAQKHYTPQHAAGAPRTYTVKAGDSLSRVAKQFYGNANDWQRIYQANKNKIKDPNIIHPGQILIIP